MSAPLEKPTTSRSDPDSRRAYTRWHYQQNAAVYKQRAKAKTAETRAAVRLWILDYLKSHPCIDCGECDPVVLEFDHRADEVKSFNIADVVRRGYTVSGVKAEVAKCDVRCANCHRRATYIRGGFSFRG